ncbi:ester cyclase [Vogesella sp. LIG4]|uniref:ester cyclase n=1 Tax=Vogesella sp. LIG4 TaxID=1192162 RepID=UPI0008201E07|nr:ester cyclase [Vogesella sp. LIG4]SCK12786.1 Predicted ester cyclase [Vogesella sp. LIG4]
MHTGITRRVALLTVAGGMMLSAGSWAATPLQVVQQYMAGWNAHDANQAAMAMDPEVEYYDVTVGESQYGVVVARDNVIRFFMNSFPDLKWQMLDKPVVTKNEVVFRWRFTGTNTGPNIDSSINEGKATGKPINFEGLSLVRIKNNKIVYQGDFYDALSLNKQLGNIK